MCPLALKSALPDSACLLALSASSSHQTPRNYMIPEAVLLVLPYRLHLFSYLLGPNCCPLYLYRRGWRS